MRDRERIRAATELDDWARDQVMTSEAEITRLRHGQGERGVEMVEMVPQFRQVGGVRAEVARKRIPSLPAT